MTPAHEILEPQWFVLIFLGAWLGVCALLALASGWFRLARSFPSYDRVAGEHFSLVSGSLGKWPFPSTHYSGCLFLTVNDLGFRLSILFLFRLLSPPLFIPWSAVQTVEVRRFLFSRYTLVWFRQGWPTLCVRGKAGRYLAEAYGRAIGGR